MGLFCLTVLLIIGIVGCSSGSDEANGSEENPINVVTTIAQIGDITENIGGDLVEVNSLMGPGVDPHLYNAVQGDIQKMTEADIIFYNGLHLEGQMGEIFAEMKQEKPTIPVAENIPKEKLLADPESPDISDPHVWFDINLWKYAAEAVRDGLIELDPDNKETYTQNTAAYLKELDELNDYALERFEEIPEQSRVLVTAHDAFNYFGKAYGFEVMGLQGLSTESDYGVNDIQRIINVLVERNIKGVFVESSVSERSINAVVEGAKEEGQEVSIGGELYSDAMGEAGTEEGTYIGMFKHNVETIVESLK
ncbi:zinc ABC transporter substrate-binding protein [Virgibacillus sp. AGTR]|uniref:metal ABC transporter solute-binding protein, Zn/Mn family n=1 Tax=uncultured Virgibacillus sp. TaxID=417355 RepID=UPI001D0418C9|nr:MULTISPECIES: zinc ABC transporter substrate-binding protein [Bacillaceae]MCC2252674.1 zinc ABC transporter substrate-binding protein [Virgibacillus sp. AGTR]MDY7045057.1 zinc ABC transporter substrate-binding protein [Virgibacillus sp. M23]WBX82212.1 zinc ABC transporter substrate-binding protein [Virgibacillus salarius]